MRKVSQQKQEVATNTFAQYAHTQVRDVETRAQEFCL